MENAAIAVDEFIEGIPIGIIVLDTDLHIKIGNKLAFQLLHIPVEDLLTQSLDTIIADNDLHDTLQQVKSGEITRQNIIVVIDNKYIKCTIDTLPAAIGDGNAHIMIIEDVTNAKQLDLLKQDFIHTILHKLRNPLTTLKTSLSIISTLHPDAIPEDTREIIDMSCHEVNRLHVLINDLRNLFLIETGLAGLDIEIETFSAADVLDRALSDFYKVPSVDAGTQKRVSCNGDLDIRMKADFEKLKQVLFILLKNAYDFSPEKTPIEINLSQNESTVTIEIRDWGIGISEESKKLLFTKFFREDNDITRATDGNGLGLFIARSLVEAMNGVIHHEGYTDAGSSFFLTLPIK